MGGHDYDVVLHARIPASARHLLHDASVRTLRTTVIGMTAVEIGLALICMTVYAIAGIPSGSIVSPAYLIAAWAGCYGAVVLDAHFLLVHLVLVAVLTVFVLFSAVFAVDDAVEMALFLLFHLPILVDLLFAYFSYGLWRAIGHAQGPRTSWMS